MANEGFTILSVEGERVVIERPYASSDEYASRCEIDRDYSRGTITEEWSATDVYHASEGVPCCHLCARRADDMVLTEDPDNAGEFGWVCAGCRGGAS